MIPVPTLSLNLFRDSKFPFLILISIFIFLFNLIIIRLSEKIFRCAYHFMAFCVDLVGLSVQSLTTQGSTWTYLKCIGFYW